MPRMKSSPLSGCTKRWRNALLQLTEYFSERLYKSRASTDVVSNEAINHLVEQSAQANKARQITGLLLQPFQGVVLLLEQPGG